MNSGCSSAVEHLVIGGRRFESCHPDDVPLAHVSIHNPKGVAMATRKEYEDAARKLPQERSTHEQYLVDRAYQVGMQSVKNIDYETQRRRRYLF